MPIWGSITTPARWVRDRATMNLHHSGKAAFATSPANEINDFANTWQACRLGYRLKLPQLLHRVDGTHKGRLATSQKEDWQRPIVIRNRDHNIAAILTAAIELGHHSHRAIVTQDLSEVSFTRNSFKRDIEEPTDWLQHGRADIAIFHHQQKLLSHRYVRVFQSNDRVATRRTAQISHPALQNDPRSSTHDASPRVDSGRRKKCVNVREFRRMTETRRGSIRTGSSATR